MTSDPPTLYLASRSPRRLTLLRDAGLAPRVVDAGVDDSLLAPGAVSPEQWVQALAYLKAAAGLGALGGAPGALVLGADTVVVKDRRIIGQPRDGADARATISALAGGRHRVVSGVALLLGDGDRGRRLALFEDAAEVAVGPIEPAAIDEYIEGGSWAGKAGGYNLSERIEAGWPITYDGDPTSVMGLPMERLTPLLGRLLRASPSPGYAG